LASAIFIALWNFAARRGAGDGVASAIFPWLQKPELIVSRCDSNVTAFYPPLTPNQRIYPANQLFLRDLLTGLTTRIPPEQNLMNSE
jgi:hypothetical protein